MVDGDFSFLLLLLAVSWPPDRPDHGEVMRHLDLESGARSAAAEGGFDGGAGLHRIDGCLDRVISKHHSHD